jgi:hypothetical protein
VCSCTVFIKLILGLLLFIGYHLTSIKLTMGARQNFHETGHMKTRCQWIKPWRYSGLHKKVLSSGNQSKMDSTKFSM